MVRRVLVLALAAGLCGAPAALADGDPASDVLPGQDAYYPYSPPASKPLVTTLNALLKQVRAAGFPMKVALIETVGDMGSYPTLFNNPQRYADLLSSELPTQADQRVSGAFHLLVVMPGGFGGEHLGDGVNRALDPVKIDVAAASDGLARAAIEAVARLATVNGHPTKVPASVAPAGGHKGGGGTSPWVFIGPLAALVLAAAAAGFVVRRRRSQ
ncbi:MAG: hypothetical protein JWM71_2489 [Solirubrobacteraceae bacterium]|nr:hypothetical protein [Solirubrobacteraceae bacterium]